MAVSTQQAQHGADHAADTQHLPDPPWPTQDSQAMMADIQTRIQKQRQMIKGFQAMRSASANPEVQRQAESNIRDAQRNVSYLEESLQALMDRGGRGSGGGGVGGGVGAGAGQGGIPSSSSRGGYDTPTGSLASQSHTGSTTSFGPSTPGSERGSTASGPSSAGMRQGYPLDASSAYRGGGPQDRPLPPAPGSAGSDGYGGGRMSYSPGGAAPAGYPQRPPQQQDGGGQWMPAPVARAGTSARRNFTNLGECAG